MTRQPYEYLAATQQFMNDFMYPRNVEIFNNGANSYKMYGDNLTGAVDVTTTFVGKEINFEYVLGFFMPNETTMYNRTRIIPYPISGEVRSLAVQNNVVSLSAIITLRYFKQQIEMPLQLDLWLWFNDQLQVVQYDSVFRRWPFAFKTYIPKLLPDIAEEEGLPLATTSPETLLTVHAARRICENHSRYCLDANLQYPSYDSCFSFLTANRTFGDPFMMGADNDGCRYIHADMLALNPKDHCPHVGPTGGGMCISRDYDNVTRQSPFPMSFNAPASFAPASLEGVSKYTEGQLAGIAMLQVSSTQVLWYPINAVVIFAVLWLSAVGTKWLLNQTSHAYRSLAPSVQRTTTMYPLSIVYTTIALGLQLAATPALGEDYTVRGTEFGLFAALIVSCLYLFELSYRDNMRLPLIAHHVLTLFAIIFMIACMQYARHPSLIATALGWLFQSTLEQNIFLGLLGYRLEWSTRLVKCLLTTGALSTLVVKLGFALYLLVWWGIKQVHYTSSIDIAFSVILWLVVPALLAAQIWGAHVSWRIGMSVSQRRRDRAIGSSETKVVSGLSTPNKPSSVSSRGGAEKGGRAAFVAQ